MNDFNIDRLNYKLEDIGFLFNKIHFFPNLDSTNLYIRRNLTNYNTGDIVLANAQTEGRGRQGKKWISNPGEGLYFSILLKNNWPLEKLNFITLVVAVSIDKALKSLGFDSKIKWPNDIYINDKKVAGILVENIIGDFNNTIIGIGVNIKNRDFNSNLKDKATSLYMESEPINREKVLYSILTKLNEDIILYTGDFDTHAFVDYIKSNSLNLNKKIKIRLGKRIIHGVLKDILFDGSIVISDNKDNIHIVSYGEIINQ